MTGEIFSYHLYDSLLVITGCEPNREESYLCLANVCMNTKPQAEVDGFKFSGTAESIRCLLHYLTQQRSTARGGGAHEQSRRRRPISHNIMDSQHSAAGSPFFSNY